MTKHLFALALAASLFAPTVAGAQTPPVAPAVPAAPVAAAAPGVKRANNNIQGKVSAVDATKNTVTLSGRRGATDTTYTLAPDAKVYVSQPAALSDIKVGDTINAYAADVTKGATTVDADRIVIAPAAAAMGRKPGKNAGYHGKRVEGVVAATTPALTITTAGGVTVTVTTTADTKVTREAPGTLAAVLVGANVQGRASDVSDTTLSELRVMPANNGRRGGARRQGRKAKAGAAPANDLMPATPAAPAQ